MREILAGISAEKAVARPAEGVHSIWELVAHVICWEQIVRRRASGENVPAPPESENFPTIIKADAIAWQKTLDDLADSHRQLQAMLAGLTDDQLRANVVGQNYPVAGMIWGSFSTTSIMRGKSRF